METCHYSVGTVLSFRAGMKLLLAVTRKLMRGETVGDRRKPRECGAETFEKEKK